jgi:hypothetical protein
LHRRRCCGAARLLALPGGKAGDDFDRHFSVGLVKGGTTRGPSSRSRQVPQLPARLPLLHHPHSSTATLQRLLPPSRRGDTHQPITTCSPDCGWPSPGPCRARRSGHVARCRGAGAPRARSRVRSAQRAVATMPPRSIRRATPRARTAESEGGTGQRRQQAQEGPALQQLLDELRTGQLLAQVGAIAASCRDTGQRSKAQPEAPFPAPSLPHRPRRCSHRCPGAPTSWLG